jgi:3'-5' exoribonuclease
MDKIFANQLSKGQVVESIFLVKEKSLTKTKSGNPYLSIRLTDRTGEVEARIWDNALDFAPLFEKDDFVKIRGEVDEYQGMQQIRVQKLRKCGDHEIRLEDFLPQSSRDPEAMFNALKEIASRVKRPFLRQLLDRFFEDEDFARKLKWAPAAKSVHHVFLGGLLEHTLSVVRLVLRILPHYEGLDEDFLIAGAILHDIGKIEELSYQRNFDYTDAGRLLGHIILTVEMIDEKLRMIPEFPEASALLLKHMILSHHGEFVFGSPKRPETLEALLLHYADDLDAKMNAFMAWIEKEKDDPSRWTTYHKLFDRFILKPEKDQEIPAAAETALPEEEANAGK